MCRTRLGRRDRLPVTPRRCGEVVERCRGLGVSATAIQGDVADGTHVRALFDAAGDLGPIHGLVNNAGIVAPMGTLAEATAARLRRIVDVNVFGALLCARELSE